MSVFRLDERIIFPDPHLGEPSGLVAVGGDLSIDRLILGYLNGYFPWYAYKEQPEPLWYCPLDRFVIFPNEIHISHSMRQLMKKDQYFVSFNADFETVIQNCATAQNRDQDQCAWLGPDMIKAYTDLHREGFAASVEVWDEHGMVGGLYGVIINDLFFGESMFSLVPNASKLALIHFATRFGEFGGKLIDCQFETPHLRSMGGRHITYEEYTQITGTLGDLTDVL